MTSKDDPRAERVNNPFAEMSLINGVYVACHLCRNPCVGLPPEVMSRQHATHIGLLIYFVSFETKHLQIFQFPITQVI